MKRLFYLTDTLESAEDISNDLHAHGVTDWHFHILGQDEAGLMRRRLHTASFLHRLDIVHSGERGVLIGTVLGALAVLVLMLFPWADNVSWLVWAAIMVFSVMAGAWVGGMAGVNMDNYKIRQFRDAIESGSYLLMIDAPRQQVDYLKSMMAKLHPEAQLQSVDSTFTNPFKQRINKIGAA